MVALISLDTADGQTALEALELAEKALRDAIALEDAGGMEGAQHARIALAEMLFRHTHFDPHDRLEQHRACPLQ